MRQEVGGKLTVLGFYGACPRVDVALQHVGQPAALTFVFLGGPGKGSFAMTFEVVDDAERVLASTAPQSFEAHPKSNTVLAPTLLLTFGRSGQFAVRCLMDGSERFRGSFRISQGIAT